MIAVHQGETTLSDNAQLAVDRARQLGAQASALAESYSGGHVTVSDGEVDTAGRDATQNLTVTVYRDGRTGSASTAMLDSDSVLRTVDEAVAIADKVEADAEQVTMTVQGAATGTG